MRQVIDGKIYDTDKAVLITIYQFNTNGDMNWVREELYRTPNGRFFLYGNGGRMTEYAEKNGAVTKLVTLSEADGIAWAERRAVDPNPLTKYIRIKEA